MSRHGKMSSTLSFLGLKQGVRFSGSCSSERFQNENCDMWGWELSSMLQNSPQLHQTMVLSQHWRGGSCKVYLWYLSFMMNQKKMALFLHLSTKYEMSSLSEKLRCLGSILNILRMARAILAFPAFCRVPMLQSPWPFPSLDIIGSKLSDR